LTGSDKLVPVGRAGRPHGLRGSFVVELASENPGRFAAGGTLWVGGEPARIVESRRARGKPVIRLDRPVERGAELAVPAAELPAPAEGAYYVFQLAGLAVEEDGGRQLGHVRDVAAGVANDVLELDTGVLLPMHEACIRRVDLAAGRIVVEPGFANHD
jgi:16S rRNA processing protein RimM